VRRQEVKKASGGRREAEGEGLKHPPPPAGGSSDCFLTLGPPEGEIIIKSLLVMTTPLPPRRDLPQGGDNSLLLIYNTIGYTELSPL